MKPSTVALVTVFTLLVVHGAHYFLGAPAILYVVVVAGAFYFVSRALYWRQLRKLYDATRDLSPADRERIFLSSNLDAEAYRDLERIARE
jgi:hypothetical protein